MHQSAEMKTSLLSQTGTASAISGKAIPVVHSHFDESQFNTVSVQTTQDNVNAPQAKQGSDFAEFSLQAELFDSKYSRKQQYAKNKSSKQISKQKESRRNDKKDKSSHKSSKPKKYVHQANITSLLSTSLLDKAKTTLLSMNLESKTSQLFSVLEVLGALAVSLPACKTNLQVASQLVLATRALTQGSLTDSILSQTDTIEWVKSHFGFNIFQQQSASSLGAGADWLKELPKLSESFSALRNSPFFNKISDCITVAASIGLCNVTNLKWSIKGVELFRVGTLRKHASALDLVSALIDTTTMFLEGGYECFKQGSLSPLFFGTTEATEFDEHYFAVVELHPHAVIFNLHDKPVRIKGEERTFSEPEYSGLLDDTIVMATDAFKASKGSWQQNVFEKRLETLTKYRAEFNSKRLNSNMREAPFSVYIEGASGVGKSSVAQVIMADCLFACGASADPRYTASIKETDKFDSSLKSDTVGVFIDDLGNTKTEFLQQSPIERFIAINNNMVTYANKADLNEKGRIEIAPKVMVTTSNADLATHARAGSIEPFSIIRRADYHLKVTVKSEFAMLDGRLDSEKVRQKYPIGSLTDDLWQIEIFRPMMKTDGRSGADNNHLIAYDSRPGVKKYYSINETLKILTSAAKIHQENQQRLVARSVNFVAERNYCPHCRLSREICECPTEKQASIAETFASIQTQIESIGNKTSAIVDSIPARIFDSRVVRAAYLTAHAKDFLAFEKRMRNITFFCTFFFTLLFSCMSLHPFVILFTLFSGVFYYYCTLAKWRDVQYAKLAARRDIAQDLFASVRHSKMLYFFSFCFAAKILYNFVNLFRTVSSVQATLAPQNVADIEHRNAEVNPWATPVVQQIDIEHTCDTMTHEQITDKVSKNLMHAKFVENDFQQECDILAIGGNLFLGPAHVFRNRKDMKVLVTRDNPDNLNSTFRGYVSTAQMTFIEGKDLALFCIPSGGVHADITHLFPKALTTSGSAAMLYRNSDGTLRNDMVYLRYTKNSESGGPGYDYTAPYDTFTGLCMAIQVAKFAKSCIAGIHLRGVTNTPRGKSLILTYDELMTAKKLCLKWKSGFPSTSLGEFPKSIYDQQVLTGTEPHPHSPLNYLPKGSSVDFLGTNHQRSSHTSSNVAETPISPLVEKHTGVENKWGPPQFRSKRMWQESLQHSANPSAGIPPTLVDRAVVDYEGALFDVFSNPEFEEMIHGELKPLTPMEALCGRDDCRFIDAQPKSTSAGFPLSGPKSNMITMLDPLDYPSHQCPAEVDAVVLDRVEHMKECFRAGKRGWSIFKACVKDEPTKKTKSKVRVFQAADWATQILIRTYFLPIARILSLFPLNSEVAVGINAQGPEWDQIARHMKSMGDKRIFAGDYSKYDLRMPAQLIIAAFKILIDIAEKYGTYSADDLLIMRALCTEVAYSCTHYNGDMIVHHGSNPSGQNLTVYINCIVNSLLMRCAYYDMFPALEGNPPPFQKAVAVMTYGDDVKGSVAKDFPWFNHISYTQFLGKHDIVFTMPDKESEPTEYMTDEDADFLKRHNRYSSDTGLIHGLLDEQSIFKSLHSVLKSKAVSLEDQSAMNIDGALREWWQYGRPVYEKRRKQMTLIAKEAGIAHACTELNTSFDDRLKLFKEKYEDHFACD
jgi:hypothetical protein